MTPDQVFTGANLVAAVTWIVLAILPRVRFVTDVLAGWVVPAVLSLLYLLVVATTFWRADGGFSTLSDVSMLFTNRWMLLGGWVHYLAFDLLIGAWEARDARERRVPHLLLLPCLLLTFMLGPCGWLLYMALRSLYSKRGQAFTDGWT